MAKTSITKKYGYKFPSSWSALEIERFAIHKGGKWVDEDGVSHGDGLTAHYLNARALIWPKRYCHRWTRLIYEQVLTNQIVVLSGSASCQKTSTLSEIVLIAYWMFPETTAVLVSTTSVDKLESAVFGEIKMLFTMGREQYPWLPGNIVDHKHAITTDNVKEDGVRDMRKGIFGKPLYQGAKYVGQSVYSGIKQERFWWLADELQFCPATLMDCIPNMRSNTGAGGLHILGSGNPNHDAESQLGIIAEPLDGWASVEENTKTSVWKIKMDGGVCVNLIGPDSPNFDTPEGDPEPYPRLIGRDFYRVISKDYGLHSPVAETQLWGRMKLGLAHSRVITRQLCRQHMAHDDAIWASTNRTKIYANDPAYGGGDRCIVGWGEFGQDHNGKTIIRIAPPTTVKINLKLPGTPEDQIADYVKQDLEVLSIAPDHAFYDSFGKGTVGYAFSRKFGMDCPIPINAGEKPTKRPVRTDLFVTDETTHMKRLKRCDEHYSKFVTEMWFSVRYVIEANQMRELPMDVMAEGCWREYREVAGGKIEVEPKDEMKERTGKSPDLFDWLAILIEGARRHGFMIDRLGVEHDDDEADDWFDLEAEKYDNIIKSKLIQHS